MNSLSAIRRWKYFPKSSRRPQLRGVVTGAWVMEDELSRRPNRLDWSWATFMSQQGDVEQARSIRATPPFVLHDPGARTDTTQLWTPTGLWKIFPPPYSREAIHGTWVRPGTNVCILSIALRTCALFLAKLNIK